MPSLDVEKFVALEGRILQPLPEDERTAYTYWRAAHLGNIVFQFINGSEKLNARDADYSHFWNEYESAVATAEQLTSGTRLSQFDPELHQVLAELVGLPEAFSYPSIVLAADPAQNLRMEKIKSAYFSNDSLEDVFNVDSLSQPYSPGGGFILRGPLTLDKIDPHSRQAIQELFIGDKTDIQFILMKDDDEILDLVDENDKVIGTIERSKTAGNKHKGYLRAAELLIVNDKGQLWIPRRTMNKRIAPGGLDFSAAGHVASGDNYKETLEKEVYEEINLKLDKSKLVFLKKFHPRSDLPPYFRAVYLYHSNEVPKYNPEDFTEYFWLTPQELLGKIKAGEPAKQSLAETAEYLLNRFLDKLLIKW